VSGSDNVAKAVDTRHYKSLELLERWINGCERWEMEKGGAKVVLGNNMRALLYGVSVVGHVIESSGSHCGLSILKT